MIKRWYFFLAAAVTGAVAWHVLFSSKLYGSHSDYIFFVPHLISNKIYFLRNGLFSIPYYTPAFHGGYSQFADMQDMTFSLAQIFINLFSNCYIALELAFVAHFILSAGGMYFFLRKFGLRRWTATLAGLIFGLNGFIVARWMVGHLIFQTLWTVPWIMGHAHALVSRRTLKEMGGPAIWIALLLSVNIFSSGLYTLLIIFLLAGTFSLSSAILGRSFPWRGLLAWVGAVALSQLLSLSKIVAVTSLLRQFPRLMAIDRLSWPMVASILPKSLFDSGAGIASRPFPALGEWHEFSAYVGVSLLISYLLGFVCARKMKPSGSVRLIFLWTIFSVAGVAFLMRGSDWLWPFLKHIPIVKSNHAPARVVGALPLVFVSLAAVLWHQMSVKGKKMMAAALVLSLASLLDVAVYARSQDLSSIYQVPLDYPRSLEKVEISVWQERNIYGGVTSPNPIFGWDYHNLKPPVDLNLPPLHRFEDGTYNINDPVAMVYSPEVHKAPWTRLDGSISQEQAERFLAFEDPGFYVPTRQRIANKLSAASWLLFLPVAVLLSL